MLYVMRVVFVLRSIETYLAFVDLVSVFLESRRVVFALRSIETCLASVDLVSVFLESRSVKCRIT